MNEHHVDPSRATKRHFDYRHTVLLEETNIVGNVYFARHIAWQGRCRETFLKQHAPATAADLGGTLRLVTTHVSCTYFEEVLAFDEITIRLRLLSRTAGKARLGFDYLRQSLESHEHLIAQGEQDIVCLRASRDERSEPQPFPADLSAALDQFSGL